MALGREMHDGARRKLSQQLVDKGAVLNISPDEVIARPVGNRQQVAQISGVGQLVQVDQRRSYRVEPVQNKMRADKSGAARDKNRGLIGEHCSLESSPAEYQPIQDA